MLAALNPARGQALMDRYVVIGNPIHHSRSPQIHAQFAEQTGQRLEYSRLLAPLDGFAATAQQFFDSGGAGANVTVPFKEDAARWVNRLDESARLAGAVNTIVKIGAERVGFNTDGTGLVRDLESNLGWSIAGKRVLLLGAGGAARGALLPLLNRAPSELVVANRTVARAEGLCAELADHFAGHFAGPAGPLRAQGFTTLSGGFDIIINATSAGLAGEVPDIPSEVVAGARCYDMVYGAATPFTRWAEQSGAARTADGLGMLVEQAAEAFWLWRGVQPQTGPVLTRLRGER